MIYPTVDTKTMLTTFAILNIIPWIKTFFFTPRDYSSKMTSYESSVVGYLTGKREPEVANEEIELQNLNPQAQEEGPSLKSSLLSRDNIVSGIFFVIMNVRAVSFPGWAYPWLQWTFSGIMTHNYDSLSINNFQIKRIRMNWYHFV